VVGQYTAAPFSLSYKLKRDTTVLYEGTVSGDQSEVSSLMQEVQTKVLEYCTVE
jgi:hypothetical protein